MLKKSASIVLASLRGSTYRSVRLASSLAAALLGTRRVSARQGWAGEKSGLFEHPARDLRDKRDAQPVISSVSPFSPVPPVSLGYPSSRPAVRSRSLS